jgi:hypothetical protein
LTGGMTCAHMTCSRRPIRRWAEVRRGRRDGAQVLGEERARRSGRGGVESVGRREDEKNGEHRCRRVRYCEGEKGVSVRPGAAEAGAGPR